MAQLPAQDTHQANSLTSSFNFPSLPSPPLHLFPIYFSTSMAALQSIACRSPISHYPQHHRLHPGISCASVSWHRRVKSDFSNAFLVEQQLHLGHVWKASPNRPCSKVYAAPIAMTVKPIIQFIQGTDELSIPDVRLTKSRDGTNGVATFRFEQPSVLDSSSELGEITGFYMTDEEGTLQSVDVTAKFVNGKPAIIEAKYVMRNPREWDRFMRFMERYSDANGLQFVKK